MYLWGGEDKLWTQTQFRHCYKTEVTISKQIKTVKELIEENFNLHLKEKIMIKSLSRATN